eukprot:CAMPEP_0202896056 /NCGR_PEP_ID=MMETSP1392-20130828/5137_1 /ASSEMBLY_ACC=CAM_ASM_000868 /TAXON_ID=225041 /ORGANISM="Chlamydomonas chlamydogama, Strain SAG 11-48b" /LENGTH=160 /DNA_ID=CAMNT_0049581281 /DNA_START=141 /DNA_END=624 /DNA_ORIENTATION=-
MPRGMSQKTQGSSAAKALMHQGHEGSPAAKPLIHQGTRATAGRAACQQKKKLEMWLLAASRALDPAAMYPTSVLLFLETRPAALTPLSTTAAAAAAATVSAAASSAAAACFCRALLRCIDEGDSTRGARCRHPGREVTLVLLVLLLQLWGRGVTPLPGPG